MRGVKFVIFYTLLVSLIPLVEASAQIQEEDRVYLYELGMGAGFAAKGYYCAGGVLSVAYIISGKDNLDQMVRAKFIGLLELPIEKTGVDKLYSLGFMYGVGLLNKHNDVFVSLGFSTGFGVEADNYHFDNEDSMFLANYQTSYLFSFGIPFEIETRLAKTEKVGFGLSLFGDVNTTNSFFGVMLKTQLFSF